MVRPCLITLLICLYIFGEIYAQTPVVSSVSPASGAVGANVTIAGSNFDAAAANNQVLFGKTAAAIVSASTTQLVVKVPAGASYNTVSVTNLSTGLRGTSSQYFDATFPLKNKMTSSNFEITTTIKLPYNQSHAAYGDLDGDGKPDLAIVNTGGTTLSLYRNIETGTNLNLNSFDAKFDLTIPKYSTRVEIQDLDGDGKPEILITTTSVTGPGLGSITIFKNNSASGAAFTAASFQQITLPFNLYPDILSVADVDGDGLQDIVALAPGANVNLGPSLVVLKNNSARGQVNASAFTENTIAQGAYINGKLAIADLDGDGKPDIVGGNIIFQNNGNLSFTSSSLGVTSPAGVAVGDINNDGKPDLLILGSSDNSLYLYQNTSAAGTLSASSFSLQSKTYCGKGPQDVKAGDLDGDGKPDVAIINRSDSTACIFKNIYNNSSPSAAWLDKKIQLNLGPVPYELQIADLNNDGLPDLLISNNNTATVTLIKNKPADIPVITVFSPRQAAAGSVVTITGKNFTSSTSNVLVHFGSRPAQVQSLNDTTVKVVVPAGATHCQLSVTVLPIKRRATSTMFFNGTFAAKKKIESSDFNLALYVPMPGTLIRFSDLDGDGLPDLVYIDNTNGQIVVQRNTQGQGNRIDCSLFTKVLSLNDPIAFSDLEIADINSDGQPDIVLMKNDTVGYYLNTSTKGSIQFAAYQKFGSPQGYLWELRGKLLDLDGDGRLDIITSDHIFRNAATENSSGVEVKSGFSFSGTSPNNTTLFVAASDVDSDGKPDLFTGEGTGGNIAIRKNQSSTGYLSDSSFSAPVSTTISGTVTPYIADADNDGLADVVSNGTLYKNITAGSNIAYQSKGTLYTNLFDFITDLNGDGQPEYVTDNGPSNGNIDTLHVYQNLALANQAPVYNTSPAKLSYARGGDIFGSVTNFETVEDLNNDNKPDLIYFDSQASRLLIFENVTASVDTDATPSITSISPLLGNIGSTVTITGNNFNPVAANNNVYFGGVLATVITASATQLTVQMPVGATYGTITVNNKITRLSATSTNSFTISTNAGKGATLATGTFGSPQTLLTGISINNGVIADLKGDGQQELVMLNSSSSIWIYTSSSKDQNNNPTNFTHTATLTTGTGSNTLLIADLDGDGKPEIINTDGQGIRIFQNNSSASCGFSFLPILLPSGAADCNVTVADINGDGKPDLLTIYSGILKVLINTSKRGSISFQPYQAYTIPGVQANQYYAFAVTDFNGDGKPDIIVDLSSAGTPTVLLQNLGSTSGNPVNFSTPIQLGFSSVASSTFNGLIARDVDGDGKPDLLVVDWTNSSLDVYKNLSVSTGLISASSLASKVSFKIPIAPQNMNVGDFDGDGKLDVVMGSLGDTTAYILQNTAGAGVIDNSSFAAPVKILIHTTTFVPSVADLNGDGKADLVILTRNNLEVLNNSSIAIPVPTITAGGPLTILTGSSVQLTANPGTGFSYQWLKDGVVIPGATNVSYNATDSGSYTVSISKQGFSKTSAAVAVNVLFAIPAGDIKITITGTSCRGASDGSITATATQNSSYVATITGNGVNASYPFNSSETISNLAAGSYSVCISVTGQPNYKQCYTAVVTEPQDLSVYSTINNEGKTITLAMTGGNEYNIQLNGVSYSTKNNSITLPLADGNNDLTVTTDKLCQGTQQKLINISGKITPYPNPFQNILYLNLDNAIVQNVSVEIHDVSDGRRVFTKQFGEQSGVLRLDVSNLRYGAYVLHLTMGNSEKIFKIAKK